MTLAVLGGAAGAVLAFVSQTGMRKMVGTMLPNYNVQPSTLAMGIGISLLIGVVAGIAPAIVASRMAPTAALRSEG